MASKNLSIINDPAFNELTQGLAGKGKADLEAYIRQLYGENGGTLADEVAAGRMTMAQVFALLIQSGFSPEQAQAMIQNNQLNIPLLTTPGELQTRMGPRGGALALPGPYAIERSMAAQEVVRRGQAIQSDAQRTALMAEAAGRQSGGGGGSRGGGGGAPPRPPLPPMPLPHAAQKPPWYSQLLGPLAGAAGNIASAWLQNQGKKPPQPGSAPSGGANAPSGGANAPSGGANARGPLWASPNARNAPNPSFDPTAWDPSGSYNPQSSYDPTAWDPSGSYDPSQSYDPTAWDPSGSYDPSQSYDPTAWDPSGSYDPVTPYQGGYD